MDQPKNSQSTQVRGATPNEGISLPEYDVFEKVGEGGMARVYRAQHKPLERLVALKILLPEFSQDASFAERFMREARIAARLVHPHIVQIYDVDQHDTKLYLAMEFVKGGDFSIRIAQGASITTLLVAVTELCEALDFAHNEGYIHRDIKPQNILFRTDGSVVLSDFGIARSIRASTQLTQAGMILGTPTYMSPEQAEGQELTGASDLYSTGVLIYEAITGSAPYVSKSAIDILHKHLSAPLPLLPEAMPLLQAFFDRALAKKPSQRFTSGAEMSAALTKALAGHTSLDGVRKHIEQWRNTPANGMYSIPAAVMPAVDRASAGAEIKRDGSRKEDASLSSSMQHHDDENDAALTASSDSVKHKPWVFLSVLAFMLILIAAVFVGNMKGDKPEGERSVNQLASFDQQYLYDLIDRTYSYHEIGVKAQQTLNDQIRRKMALGKTGDEDVDQIINAAIIDRHADVSGSKEQVTALVIELAGHYSRSESYLTKQLDKKIQDERGRGSAEKLEWLRQLRRTLADAPSDLDGLKSHVQSKLLETPSQ